MEVNLKEYLTEGLQNLNGREDLMVGESAFCTCFNSAVKRPTDPEKLFPARVTIYDAALNEYDEVVYLVGICEKSCFWIHYTYLWIDEDIINTFISRTKVGAIVSKK